MGQNTSFAVMQQRHDSLDELDDFPTPPWAARALMHHVLFPSSFIGTEAVLARSTCLEPACGRGHMKRTLQEYFSRVRGSDVHDYGHGAADDVIDFLDPRYYAEADWVVTNPPYKLAEAFVHKALSHSRVGVAILVRAAFLEGVKRHKSLFLPHPPTLIAQFTERVPMHKGRLLRKGKTATAYCWLVWIHGWPSRPFIWIPPCRKKLETDFDYLWSGEN